MNENQAPITVELELKRAWFPHEGGMVLEKTFVNPNRLHSLWLGLTFPIIHLPFALWHMLLVPLFFLVLNLLLWMPNFWLYGLAGWAHGWKNPDGINLNDPQSIAEWAQKKAAEKQGDAS
jgi:hypothetical protein